MSEVKIFRPLVGTELVKKLIADGHLPTGTTRCIIDSGNPGEAVRIYWAGFANVDMIAMLMKGLTPMRDEIDPAEREKP